MDVQDLAAFVAVAETGSFSRAGERIHLTQPAVSKRVAALEGELGARLFDRLGRRVVLTEAGRTLEPLARRVLADMREGRRAIDNLRGTVRGALPLVTSHHIGLRRMPDTLRRFHKTYPEVRLDLDFMGSERAREAVERGDFELGVITLPPEPPGNLQVQPLWEDPLVIVAATDHPLAAREWPAVADLAGFSAILPAAGTYTREIIEATTGAAGLDVLIETHYLETIRTMVAAGLGWSALPRTMLGDGVEEIRVAGVAMRRRLGVVHHARRTLSNASRAMIDMLRDGADEPADQPKSSSRARS